MTPREILTQHISKIPGAYVRDVQKVVDGAMREIEEYGFVIVDRADLMKDPVQLAALLRNPAKRNTSP